MLLALGLLWLCDCEKEMAPEVVRTEYIFTSSYAKTPTPFFAVKTSALYRVPLSDIARQREITLPDTYKGHVLEGYAICGVTKKELFVCRSYSDVVDPEFHPPHYTYITYRISLESLDITVIDAGSCLSGFRGR